MCDFHDAVSDIFTECKTKLLGAKKGNSMDEEQATSALVKSTRIPSHVFGVQNIGNTCFFNSTMQALNATRELVDFYVSNQEMFEDDSLLMSKLT